MSIYRGAGGASDATDDSTVNAVAGYASAAASSASSAATSATNASNSATAAASSASSAASSASSVATNASNAASSAGLANTYATAASVSKDAAAASATTASTKAGEASTSASNAATSASTASTQATNAASSASAAATSASAASTSASNAASSAASALAIYGNTTAMNNAVAAAATSAANAATSAAEADDSRVLAEAAVTSASSYASASQASANDSQAYAGASEAFKDSALAAASDANTYATNAGASASDAADSALEAANSAAAAAAVSGSGNGTFVNTPVTTNSTITLSSGTANGVAYLNGSKVLTTGSGLVFNGTNLGIGTTSPLLRFDAGVALSAGTIQDVAIFHQVSGANPTTGQGARIYLAAHSNTSRAAAIQALVTDGLNGHSLQFLTQQGGSTPSVRATIDAVGNLGLGVTPSAWTSSVRALETPTGAFYSYASGTTSNFYMLTNAYFNGTNNIYKASNFATQYLQSAGQHIWYNAPSGTAGTAITFTQAMTLDSSGNLLVGTTSAVSLASSSNTGTTVTPSGVGIFYADNAASLYLGRQTADGAVAQFRRSGTAVGSISVTTTATAYNTSSDYRLKNITGPITNSGAYIDSLNPVEGTWKADGSVFVGLIAHEVQEASRTNVATGVKDGEEMQGMDYSSSEIIANMIAEVKSLRVRVAQLESPH